MVVDAAEKAGWSRSVRGWGSGLKPQPTGTHLRGNRGRIVRTAGPPDVSVFHREDVGWWRSWLQQSYQAVKEKVSRAGSLPLPGPRTASVQLGAASPDPCGGRAAGMRTTLPAFSPFRAPERPIPTETGGTPATVKERLFKAAGPLAWESTGRSNVHLPRGENM